jgi:hypothetical protein
MARNLNSALGTIMLLACGLVHAQEAQREQPNDCVTQAATYHRQNSWILRAILKVESGFNPNAQNRNRNGTIDVGIAQINSMHFAELAKHGIAPEHLLNACTSSYVAAWHLSKQVSAYGNSWYAIGAYHSRSPCLNNRYVALVWNTLIDWRIVTGGKRQVVAMSVCTGVPDKSPNSTAAAAKRMNTVVAADFSERTP